MLLALGKTFTMANIIQKVQKPTLVLAHNKTLAGQLYSEFKEFFPENAVEYFVSYYDYYQPESYIPQSDTYIEKDASINDEIDKLRHSATLSLFERKDVIIIASVSCIYGLGDPEDYQELMLSLRPGMAKSRNDVMKKLVEMQYTRNEIDFKRGTFRAKGDILEIYPSNTGESAMRLEFWGDEIEKITEINPLNGKPLGVRTHVLIGPNSHYATSENKLKGAISTIEAELEERVRCIYENDYLPALHDVKWTLNDSKISWLDKLGNYIATFFTPSLVMDKISALSCGIGLGVSLLAWKTSNYIESRKVKHSNPYSYLLSLNEDGYIAGQ